MVENAPHLDGSYAAFGKITRGLDTLDRIFSVPRDHFDRPFVDQIISSIRVEA